ncbi:hypothetical protein EDB19DRAFT_1908580 [Suillus lakei]|nr:hypothetical protein EDB19DRAFT_1908580 [Suillus lakei]
MSSHNTLQKSFAVERSDSPASSGGRASTKKLRPILRDLRNTLALQATESSRYSIEQGVPFGVSSFSVTESPSSPERLRHHHGNGKYRVGPVVLPVTPHTAPSPNMLWHAPVDAFDFHVSNRDTPAEEENIFDIKRSSSMIISHFDHGSSNIDDTSSPLESRHAAIYHCTKPLKSRSAPMNRRVVDQKALVFTIPPALSHTPAQPTYCIKLSDI